MKTLAQSSQTVLINIAHSVKLFPDNNLCLQDDYIFFETKSQNDNVLILSISQLFPNG